MTSRVLWRFWIPIYLMLLSCIIAAMLYARQQAREIYETENARKDWQEWVHDAREQEEGEGPIRRRAPKTNTPPALIMMRDYAGVAFAAAIVLTSAVYWSLAFLLHGVLTKRPMSIEDE